MGGGGGFSLGSLFNVGNRNFRDTRAQAIFNVIDPAGSTGMVLGLTGAFGQDQYREGGDTPAANVVDYPEPTPAPEIPPDPAIAQMAASEEARQTEMRKRRLRTKTLLSDQDATGQATVGTKVLLGG
jgi:hypothetical protein